MIQQKSVVFRNSQLPTVSNREAHTGSRMTIFRVFFSYIFLFCKKLLGAKKNPRFNLQQSVYLLPILMLTQEYNITGTFPKRTLFYYDFHSHPRSWFRALFPQEKLLSDRKYTCGCFLFRKLDALWWIFLVTDVAEGRDCRGLWRRWDGRNGPSNNYSFVTKPGELWEKPLTLTSTLEDRVRQECGVGSKRCWIPLSISYLRAHTEFYH